MLLLLGLRDDADQITVTITKVGDPRNLSKEIEETVEIYTAPGSGFKEIIFTIPVPSIPPIESGGLDSDYFINAFLDGIAELCRPGVPGEGTFGDTIDLLLTKAFEMGRDFERKKASE
ncbi:MAG: hypothetical protein HY092_03085 [Candidatus Kerfeldbacteria bacterium]|nr:hypothetical protein [Candidatus Kerfeldbacteria bacterium]